MQPVSVLPTPSHALVLGKLSVHLQHLSQCFLIVHPAQLSCTSIIGLHLQAFEMWLECSSILS